MANYNDIVQGMKKVAESIYNGSVPGGFTRAKLEKLNPLTFRVNSKLSLYGQFLVVPKYKVFRPEDIGKDFVFFIDSGGQTFYYVYEPSSPQGSNGVPYRFEGEIKCNLKGTCPEGEVVVTGGYVEMMEHKRQV